jgi:predicted RNA-binding protein with PUA-like domain
MTRSRERRKTMNFLFKEEPTHYGFDDLARDGKTTWSGVKNALAQKHLKLVRISRLSVMPVTDSEWATIEKLSATLDSKL